MGDIPRCVYCGWTKDEALRRIGEAGKLQTETFRSGGTLWPFVGSSVLLGGLGLLGAWMELKGGPHPDAFLSWILIAACLFLGPALCAVQILRRNLLWVRLDPERGLEMPGRGLIPWNRIASVDRYPGLLSYKDALEQLSGQLPHGAAAYRLGCAVVPALVMALVFLPVIVVLSPWHDRVTIVLTSGERIVLRDLDGSERFSRQARYKVG